MKQHTYCILLFADGFEAIYSALEASRQLMDNCPTQKLDESLKETCIHKWPFIQSKYITLITGPKMKYGL